MFREIRAPIPGTLEGSSRKEGLNIHGRQALNFSGRGSDELVDQAKEN